MTVAGTSAVLDESSPGTPGTPGTPGSSDAAQASAWAAPAQPSAVSVVAALARREVVRFARQRSRLMGALLTPVVFWLLLGFGLDRAVSFDGAPVAGASGGSGEAGSGGLGYLDYFLPGSLLLVVLFSSIFSTMTLIEDRRDGFLESVLASPASRGAIVLGRVLGGAGVAWGQAGLFLLLAPLFGVSVGPGALVLAWLASGVAALGLTAAGVWTAWGMTSTSAYHAVMNLVLMPAWLLSGAVFPVGSAAGPIRAVMLANPMTYAQAWVARVMHGPASGVGLGAATWLCAGVVVGGALLAVAGAVRAAHRPSA